MGSFPKMYNDPHLQCKGKTLIFLQFCALVWPWGSNPQPRLFSQALYRLSLSSRGLINKHHGKLSFFYSTTDGSGSTLIETYPSPKPTLTLTSHFGQNVGLGKGWVSSFPKTYNDPHCSGSALAAMMSSRFVQFFGFKIQEFFQTVIPKQ